VCHTKGLEIDVVFNAKKSKLFVVGEMCDVEIGCLQIGGNYISWCTQMKYLCIHFRSDYNLDYDLDYTLRKFYTSANSICNHSHFASEISKLFLLETYCLPLISYSCEALNYNNKQLNRLNACWNNAYRKILRMNVWESVKKLQLLCERLDFKHIYNLKKLLFHINFLE